jgi:hypothetical protein
VRSSVRNESGDVDLRMLISTLNWRENAVAHPREENKGGERGSDFTVLNNLEVNYNGLLNRD